jgi:hypothetical protein
VDVSGSSCADLDELLDLGDGDVRRRRHHRVEVHRGVAIDEVAVAVALPRLHDGEIPVMAGSST